MAIFPTFSFANGYTLMTINASHEKGAKTAEGFFIELINEMFDRAKIPLRTKEEPWIRSQQKVIHASPDEALVIAPLTRTAERENQYDWVVQLVDYRLQFVTNDKTKNLADMTALKEEPICVLRASPAEGKLKKLGFTNIKASVFEQRCFQDMIDGKIKLILVHGNIGAERNYKNVGGKIEDLIFGGNFEEEDFYLASTRNAVSNHDKNKLNKALEEIRADGTYQIISDKYFK